MGGSGGRTGSERVNRVGAITCLLGRKRSTESWGGAEKLVSGVGVITALL